MSPTSDTPRELTPGAATVAPLLLAVGLFVIAAANRENPELARSIAGAGIFLVLWSVGLFVRARSADRSFSVVSGIYAHHWVQACAQLTVLLYWGWHARFVYGFLPLILTQVIFAYGVDMLLTWSRRPRYSLGFGPVPVILSINLFLWFRPEWFHWQFVMILLGYVGKEVIRWNRDGRSRHIFNPSSFPLAVFSLALIITGSSDITYGTLIANTQFDPPNMYLVIFLASVPGMLLFGVANMTLPAVATMYAISSVYFASTGTYLFFDAHIPVPVFLGMHLLFTDPSTAPRTDLGRLGFGVLYGVGTTVLFVLLSGLGEPTFYDKLLPVPIMNLMVRRIDSWVRRGQQQAARPSRRQALTPRGKNAAYTSAWALAFLAMTAQGTVGDRHPGQYLPFWQTACRDGNTRACDYASYLTLSYCNNGSGWACNEVGVGLVRSGRSAGSAFQRSCAQGYDPGCRNQSARSPDSLRRSDPRVDDLPILLRGTKPALAERDPDRLRTLACEQGWSGFCGGSA